LTPGAPLKATGVTITGAVEGTPFTGTVATFTDGDANAVPSDFAVTINWGDGTPLDTTSGHVTGGGGNFTVTGTHTYATDATYQVKVTITDVNTTEDVGGGSDTATSLADVANGPLTVTGVAVTVPTGVTATNVLVATFTDAGGPDALGKYSAVINWGDGSEATPGTISLMGSTFRVTGSHTFKAPGKFTIATTVSEATDQPAPTMATGTATAFIGNQNERFIGQIYLDLLRRQVDPVGLSIWTGMLNMGVSRTQVASMIEASDEYRGVEVRDAFSLYLHRGVDQANVNGFIAYLQQGHTVEQMAAILIGSPEYFMVRGGSNNDKFIDAVYSDILGRPVDTMTRMAIDQGLMNGSLTRSQLATNLFNTDEFRQRLVVKLFGQFLMRSVDPTAPPPAGGAGFVDMLRAGARDEDIIAILIGSTEYLIRRVNS
jgi:hypothetical protein